MMSEDFLAWLQDAYGDIFHEWQTSAAERFFADSGISKRNWGIFMRHIGLADGSKWTLERLANRENVSRVRVWQIVHQTRKNLTRLRKAASKGTKAKLVVCGALLGFLFIGCRDESGEQKKPIRQVEAEATAQSVPTSPTRQANGDEWWKFPHTGVEIIESTPPNPPWNGTNYPYASFSAKVQNPQQGRLSDAQYRALQDFLGAAITHGRTPHRTVEEAISRIRMPFWEVAIWERRNPADWGGKIYGYDIFELEGLPTYQTEKFYCYKIRHQEGPASASVETYVVWSWERMSPVKIGDILDLPRHEKRLRRLMRRQVLRDWYVRLGKNFNPDTVLADYARNWPHEFDNFYLSDKGITWVYEAGCVQIGAMGMAKTTLSWEILEPYLVDKSLMPTGRE